jgi:periplasmic divalent cation tolerance protein
MKEIIWVIVSCNSLKEAEKIGRVVLKQRLCACFSIIPRIKTVYFWPPRLASANEASRGGPKSNKLQTSKGPLLTLETLEKNYQKISKFVRKLHSDKIPLIGQWEIEEVKEDFYNWLKREIK